MVLAFCAVSANTTVEKFSTSTRFASHVRIAQGSEFMIHNPIAGCRGTAADFERMFERLTKMQKDQHEMYAARSGQTPEKIKEWMDAETWFTAKETVEFGFADELMQAAEIAACASQDDIDLMRQLYNSVPEEIGVKVSADSAPGEVSNAEPQVIEGSVSENNNTFEEGIKEMEIKEITAQQLQAENPELLNAIIRQGVEAERTRIQEIDAMTPEGYEEMAKGTVIAGSKGILKCPHGPVTQVEETGPNAMHKTYIKKEVPLRYGSIDGNSIDAMQSAQI